MNIRHLISGLFSLVLLMIGTKFQCKHHEPSLGPVLMGADTTYLGNTLLNVEVNDLTKLEWSNDRGRKEAISKEEGIWHYAGMEAVDSTRMHSYLLELVNIHGMEFIQLPMKSTGMPVEKLILFGNTMIEPILISAYRNADSSYHFLIHSSQNADLIFLSDSLGIYKRIFGDLRQFWPDGQ